MSITLDGTNGITTPDVDSTTSVTTPLVTSSGALALSTTSANAITASTNGAERMRINSAGNVGIGTTSPTNLLTLSGSGAAMDITDTTRNLRAGVSAAGTTFGYLTMTTNHALTFGTNNTERARIDASGNLLVGTTVTEPNAVPYIGFRARQSGIVTNDAQIFMGRNPGVDYRAIVIATGNFPNGPTNPGMIEWQDFSGGNSRRCRILGSKGQVFVIDNSNNRTQISPHSFEMIPNGPSEPLAWSYASRVQPEGRDLSETDYIACDMTKAMRLVESLTGQKLVYKGVGNSFDTAEVSENIVGDLTAALQEALQKIEALEARITALEA